MSQLVVFPKLFFVLLDIDSMSSYITLHLLIITTRNAATIIS